MGAPCSLGTIDHHAVPVTSCDFFRKGTGQRKSAFPAKTALVSPAVLLARFTVPPIGSPHAHNLTFAPAFASASAFAFASAFAPALASAFALAICVRPRHFAPTSQALSLTQRFRACVSGKPAFHAFQYHAADRTAKPARHLASQALSLTQRFRTCVVSVGTVSQKCSLLIAHCSLLIVNVVSHSVRMGETARKRRFPKLSFPCCVCFRLPHSDSVPLTPDVRPTIRRKKRPAPRPETYPKKSNS